jgi:hypothetical protein
LNLILIPLDIFTSFLLFFFFLVKPFEYKMILFVTVGFKAIFLLIQAWSNSIKSFSQNIRSESKSVSVSEKEFYIFFVDDKQFSMWIFPQSIGINFPRNHTLLFTNCPMCQNSVNPLAFSFILSWNGDVSSMESHIIRKIPILPSFISDGDVKFCKKWDKQFISKLRAN